MTSEVLFILHYVRVNSRMFQSITYLEICSPRVMLFMDCSPCAKRGLQTAQC